MTIDPELVEVDPATTAVIPAVVTFAGLRDFFDQAFRTLPPAIIGQGRAITGAAFCLYHGIPAETFDLEAGFVVDGKITPSGDVRPGSLPGGRVARLIHVGSYDGLGGSWERLHTWVAANGLTRGDSWWETYVTEPTPDTDPATLRTELNLQVLG